ncbi:S-layer homology domain-containing protein [Candidatus Bipolaricaulota bacterium]|nr:S-layer homology domain-containing protein [Candidatus Bipolaricaulota bacterium]
MPWVVLVAALIAMAVGLGAIGQTGNGTAEPPNTGGLFTDVPRDHWAYEDLEYLAARGIITGLPGGVYNGDSPLDRYSGAAMIARAIKYMQSNPESVTPEDLDVLKNLIFQVSDDVAALQSGGVQGVNTTALEARVGRVEQDVAALGTQVGELSGTSAASLTKRVQANFIISLTALLVGIIGVALATLGL